MRPDTGTLPERMKCMQCGLDFQPDTRYRRTCSAECLHELRVSNRAEHPPRKGSGAEPMRDLGRVCGCGQPIIRRNKSAKRCIDCAARLVGTQRRGRRRKADVKSALSPR